MSEGISIPDLLVVPNSQPFWRIYHAVPVYQTPRPTGCGRLLLGMETLKEARECFSQGIMKNSTSYRVCFSGTNEFKWFITRTG